MSTSRSILPEDSRAKLVADIERWIKALQIDPNTTELFKLLELIDAAGQFLPELRITRLKEDAQLAHDEGIRERQYRIAIDGLPKAAREVADGYAQPPKTINLAPSVMPTVVALSIKATRAWAHKYAAAGVKIFLLNPDSKEPLGANGTLGQRYARLMKINELAGGEKYSYKTPTADSKIIAELFNLCDACNIMPGIGIPCQANSLVCFDADRHTDGIDGIANFLAHMDGESLNDCAVQHSASGGCHYIWRVEDKDLTFPKTLCPGVDIKWIGYFCAEPTLIHGKPYKWETGRSLIEVWK